MRESVLFDFKRKKLSTSNSFFVFCMESSNHNSNLDDQEGHLEMKGKISTRIDGRAMHQ